MMTLWARAALVAIVLIGFQASGAMSESASAPVAHPLASPVAEALRTELVLASNRQAPERLFYAAHKFAPLWLAGDGTPTGAVQALLAWVEDADGHALPEERYGVNELRTRLTSIDTHQDSAQLELDLTRLFLDYARDLSSGVLEPRDVSREIDIKPPRPDPARLLSRAVAAKDLSVFLASLAPSSAEYDRLVGLYGTIRGIADNGGWGPEIAQGPTLRLGDRDKRVERIRTRLVMLGDLPTVEQVAANDVMTDAKPAHDDRMVLDAALEAAIRRFQERHGLNTDGAVGPMTRAALNVPAEKRAEQVAVNLERMRWLNKELGRRHVIINTAGFRMTYYEDGAERFTTRAVVGKARRHETPEFQDLLEYIVVNPIWNVPNSIATEEILPELREDPGYLARHNMELVGADLPISEIDWTEVTPRTFPGRIRQRPGPGNALGSVKFLFPNKYAIYMHDTPAQRLFRRDRRDFSHGCVRLADPVRFAHILLEEKTTDPAGLFDRLRGTDGERWVKLERPIPVYVTYRTAWVAPDGSWQFRGDVYGRDEQVAVALRAAGVSVTGR